MTCLRLKYHHFGAYQLNSNDCHQVPVQKPVAYSRCKAARGITEMIHIRLWLANASCSMSPDFHCENIMPHALFASSPLIWHLHSTSEHWNSISTGCSQTYLWVYTWFARNNTVGEKCLILGSHKYNLRFLWQGLHKSSIFCNIMPHNVVEVHQSSSETLISFYQTTWHDIPEDFYSS